MTEPAALAFATFDEDAPLPCTGAGTYKGGYQDEDGLGGRLRSAVRKVVSKIAPVSVDAAILNGWAEQKSRRSIWRVLCLKFCRSMYRLPVVAPSAKAYGDMVPERDRHYGQPEDAPRGSLSLYAIGDFDHIVINIGKKTSDKCLSNDYINPGRIDPAPRDLPRWGVRFRFWTEWTAHGLIDLETRLWDGTVPPLESVLLAMRTGSSSPAAYRVACRLADLGFYKGDPLVGEQTYPRKALKALQRKLAKAGDGTLTHKAFFD